MLKIEIEIPRPVASLIVLGVTTLAVLWVRQVVFAEERMHSPAAEHPASLQQEHARGGPVEPAREEVVHAAERDALGIRSQQAMLQRREEILRAQLEALEEERRLRSGGQHPVDEQELQQSEALLRQLLTDQKEAEKRLLESLQQLRDAEGIARATERFGGAVHARLEWPVEPELGVSAGFQDDDYQELFGVPHGGIDLPVPQGSVIHAAADGIVEKVADNGYGFNSVTVMHDGYATLYGHVTSFLVEEGQRVRQGDPVALSGGRPGTPGAGSLTTGPHLHFELFVDGARTDPMQYLPYHAALSK